MAKDSLSLLDRLIAKTKAMTPEEFAAKEKENGIDKVVFNPNDYIDITNYNSDEEGKKDEHSDGV